MQRHALGIISLISLTAAVYGLVKYGISDGQTSVFASACLRIGLVLGAVWLAYPQLIKLRGGTSGWFIALLGGIALCIAVRPRLAVVLVPIMLILIALQFFGWLIKPLPNKSTAARQRPPTTKKPTRSTERRR